MPDTIHLASYIVERIKQAGVKQFLDYFEKDPVLQWVGNANELNAAYAADGYARVKGGLAVLVTTFGVGELSAMCGVAGSLAERLPVLHIVGSPSTAMQSNHALLHHTLNTGSSFQSFSKMSEPISCAQALLNSIKPETPHTYADAVDEAIRQCVTQCRPAYIELPMDCVRALVSTEGLQKPLPTPYSAPPMEDQPTSVSYAAISSLIQNSIDDHFDMPSEEVCQHVVDLITQRFADAKRPCVLVDACAARFGVGKLVRHLVETCGIRGFTTPMGKGILDEHSPLFGGCYAGANSLEAVKNEIQSSDFVLYVGALKSDFNSGSFSVNIPTQYTARLHSFTTNVGFASFPTTDIRHVLPRLLPAFEKVAGERKIPVIRDTLEQKMETGHVERLTDKVEGREIVHAWMWRRLGSWFQDNDIIITETGTSSFGLLSVPIPSNATYEAQILWGAIGWSVGATLGCALAAEEGPKRRTVLFVGDGSLQLTVQEIGTMVRRGVKPYLFVINNDGYEIERQIHGKHADYNNIQPYAHQLMLPFLGGNKPEEKTQSFEVRTQEEMQALLNDKEFNIPDRIRMIEVFMPRDDAPKALLVQAKLTAEANSA